MIFFQMHAFAILTVLGAVGLSSATFVGSSISEDSWNTVLRHNLGESDWLTLRRALGPHSLGGFVDGFPTDHPVFSQHFSYLALNSPDDSAVLSRVKHLSSSNQIIGKFPFASPHVLSNASAIWEFIQSMRSDKDGEQVSEGTINSRLCIARQAIRRWFRRTVLFDPVFACILGGRAQALEALLGNRGFNPRLHHLQLVLMLLFSMDLGA